ncbi:RagB/SusD family nutrient uptake outer membrane protein [Chryseobacterium oryctis]|uniref:RagB/SusD family nutrient uptake outer membrane protein n=1 Tax=Chryseobacterium oryctis TaxID=2952618 RepID=A0ABT3HQY3_9FLAO|nr:RagB/SusD family nutrient uptake outer membrane protein [Chryseobacterium oryctis]MCW3162154.1 RagB/SusD family nutrient uptake outer membrane protein [Chryseobacterium oryctis]
MKKIIYTALFCLSVSSAPFLLNSCQDSLEIIQPGEVTDEVLFTNVDNLATYLNGVYARFEPSYGMYLTAVLTDEVKPGKGSGGQEFQLHRFFLNTNDTYTSRIWLYNYNVINRVNRLLEGAKNITPTSAAETIKYNNTIAQARALRAYAYLELETYFSTNMKDENALGVMLVDNVPATTDIKLPRVANKEIYALINADLDYARTILTNSTDRYHVDQRFVNAVAARFNLYRGNYSLAKQYAQAVINSGLALTQATPIDPDGDGINTAAWRTKFYSNTPFNPYRKIWADTDRGEVIFALNRLASGNGASIGTYWNTNASQASGVPMWYWGRNLFNIFYNTDGDIRRYAYLDPSSTVDANYLTSSSPTQTDVLIVDKYPGKTGSTTRNDVKLFRISEMYFILAECAVEENDFIQAQNYVQAVRAARNYKGTATTPTYATQQAALADILKERRVELALEGHRYIDLKRLATRAGVTMDRNPTDDNVAVSNLTNDSYKYTLPIPLSEIAANPSAQQNPGYN